MKTICKKRFLSLILTLVLCVSCSMTCLAADNTNEVAVFEDTKSDNGIMPLADQQIAGMHTGTTSTSKTSSNFTIASWKKANMSVEISVSSPCVLYFFINDSSGNNLGVATFNATKAGSYTFIPSPSSLGSGNYNYQFMFDKSGISYTLMVYTTY